MTSQTVVMVMITVAAVAHVVSSLATGTRENQFYTESAKASELRKRLLHLHDVLQNYEKKEIFSRENNPTKQSTEEAGREELTVKDVNPQQQEDDANVQSTTSPSTHLEPRALQAEDMKRSLERDSDESDLKNLYKTKVRRQEDSVQILAKVLSQLRDIPSQDSEDATGDYLENSKSSPKEISDQLASNGQTMESYILDALKRLDKGEEGKKKDNNKHVQLPLFRAKDDGRSGYETRRIAPGKQQQAVMVGDLYSHKQDDGYTDEDIIKALLNSGYMKTEEDAPQDRGKPQALDAIENSLMTDIQAANDVGVSVQDLIDDLEDKTFKEAILERLHRIMAPR